MVWRYEGQTLKEDSVPRGPPGCVVPPGRGWQHEAPPRLPCFFLQSRGFYKRCPPARRQLFGSQLSLFCRGEVWALVLLGLHPLPWRQHKRLRWLLVPLVASKMREGTSQCCSQHGTCTPQQGGRGGLNPEFNLYSFESFFIWNNNKKIPILQIFPRQTLP